MLQVLRYRLYFSVCWLLLILPDGIAATVSPKPTDSAVPLAAVPAFLDVVTFEFRTENENHKVVVTMSPQMLRVDEPDDRYSIIYNPQTDFYIGLEHGNYTYWQFSWPEVRDAVETSKRHESRLQELSMEGLNGDTTPSPAPTTNAPDATSTLGGDDSGYVWHPTKDKKNISDLDCVRWIGDTVSGENVEVWCYGAPLPKVQAAIDRLRLITEPISLVPVRTLVPDFIFPVYQALAKGGVTPVLMTWGDDQNKSTFRFVEAKTREGKSNVFTVPKLYMKTTLITMDGLIDSQPAGEPRKAKPAKTWQN
jgi:hypothetical protein